MKNYLLTELKKLPNNPRTISKENFEILKKSIKKYGIIEGRPFLISTRTGKKVIIGGNQRYEVCKELGIKEVPVYIFYNLTENEEKEIIIRDNISNGQWDMEILANENEWENEELIDWGLNIQDMKFDENIDFDNIKGNENRELEEKIQNISCPKCGHNFNI